MKNTKRLLAILSVGIAVSVSYTTETQGVMSLTTPETTVTKEIPQQEAKMVPFVKVMELAFVEDYVDTDITTEVRFITIAKMLIRIPKYEQKKYITIIATPPGLSGGRYVMIPKDKSDLIFSATVGDILTIIGRPKIVKINNSEDVIFIATSACKTGTESHHKAQTQPIPENQPKTSQSSQQTQGDKKKASTDIPSDTAMRLERERAHALGVDKK